MSTVVVTSCREESVSHGEVKRGLCEELLAWETRGYRRLRAAEPGCKNTVQIM